MTATIPARFPGFREKPVERIPSGRLGRPGEFAGIAVYLMSDAATYHMACDIVIDGANTTTLR